MLTPKYRGAVKERAGEGAAGHHILGPVLHKAV